eukprot:273756_1
MTTYNLLKKASLGFIPSLSSLQEDTTLSPKQNSPSFSFEEDLKLNPQAKAFVPSSGFHKSKSTKFKESEKPKIMYRYTKTDHFKPNYKPRAKFNVYIGKPITKNLISQISESFPNTSSLYQYLDISIAFQMSDNQMYLFKSNDNNKPSISFIHFDLHSKHSNKTLYGIVLPNESVRIKKCNVNCSNMNLQWVWKLDNFLTAKQIYESYHIKENDLPKSSRELHGLTHSIINTSINFDGILNDSNILYDTKWNNNNIKQIGKIFKYKKSMKKLKLELKCNNWIKKCQKSWNDLPTMPIIVHDYKNDNIFHYWIEWIKLIKINISNNDYFIGISFKKIKNKWKLQSIYLNTVEIANAHRLFGYFESNYVKCLDEYDISIAEIQWL